MTYWHLTKDHLAINVTADEAQYLESQGEEVTSDPFKAANWED